MKNSASTPPALLLGIEGGGTRTVAMLATRAGELLQRIEAGPANLRLLSDAELARTLQELAARFPPPDALGFGMAGVRNGADELRIRTAAASVWPGVPSLATHDLETALLASQRMYPGETCPRVIVLSGTGSCCYGRNGKGAVSKAGGWGHLLGDRGSGYEIGLDALRKVICASDRDGRWPALGRRILETLLLNEPNELIAWAQGAPKKEIAALAVPVFAAARRRDALAAAVLQTALQNLAADAVACAGRLANRTGHVRFVFTGSVLLKQPQFASAVGRAITELWPNARVGSLRTDSAWGAIELAQRALDAVPEGLPGSVPERVTIAIPSPHAGLVSTQLSPTEARNPRSLNLDRLSTGAAIELMLAEESGVPKALLRHKTQLARVVGWIAAALRNGGRLLYVGAGTSGRLGVLDASECPPTFRTDPEQIQGIIAGGQTALWRSIEGAEDNASAGGDAMRHRHVNAKDMVVGIAASGRTPFVWGALQAARVAGAKTILLCFNPHLRIPRSMAPDLVIAVDLGPEVLTGSTRLKAGTATKLILNCFSTVAMVKLGKVVSNLMADVNPSNTKLRERAVRITCELAGAGEAEARAALEKCGWVIQEALRQFKRQRGDGPA
jgi:N-acetylmuramic acid 6-phosphate etherase